MECHNKNKGNKMGKAINKIILMLWWKVAIQERNKIIKEGWDTILRGHLTSYYITQYDLQYIQIKGD